MAPGGGGPKEADGREGVAVVIDNASNSLACDLLQHAWCVPSLSMWEGLLHPGRAHFEAPGPGGSGGNGLKAAPAVESTKVPVLHDWSELTY